MRISARMRRWVQEVRDRTDAERAEAAAPRVWRYITCWEILRNANGEWVLRSEIERQLGCSSKAARRTLHHLEATSLIEVRWGDSCTNQSRARIKKGKR